MTIQYVTAQFTVITYSKQLMGKEFTADGDKAVSKTDGTGHHGYFNVEQIHNLTELCKTLEELRLDQIVVHGVPLRDGVRNGYVHTGVPPSYMDLSDSYDLERKKEHLRNPSGGAMGSLDSDFDTAPEGWTKHLKTPAEHLGPVAV